MTRASPRRRSTRSRWRRASRHGRLLAGPHRRACARRSPKRSGRCAVERRHPAGRRRGRRRHARPHRAVRARGPHARAVSRLPPRAPARLRCRRGQRHTRSRSERQQEGRRGPAPYGIHGLLCASGPHARARRGALARGPSRGLGAGDRWRAGARLRRRSAPARCAPRVRAHARAGVLRKMWLRADQPRAAPGEERRRVPGLPQALRVRRARDAPASRRDRPAAARAGRAGGLHAALSRPRARGFALNRSLRLFAAAFDTVAMAGVAYVDTGGRFARNLAEYVLWGSVLAAAICAFVIATSGAGALAWVAIGYVLFGGALTAGSPHWGLVLLALALMPLVPRPNGSLVLGLGIAVVAAFASRVAIGLIL